MLTDAPILFTIETRFSFPGILNEAELLGEGVEIGVQEGIFSKWILQKWKGKKLYSIDPWNFSASDTYNDIANVSQENQEKNFQTTSEALKKFGERSQIIRDTSKNASQLFKPESLDFAYIDAQHHYEAVVEDIELWWPKIKPMGILAGHDYIPDGVYPFGDFGVKGAVDEFVIKNNLDLILSTEIEPGTPSGPKPHSSWFIVKKI